MLTRELLQNLQNYENEIKDFDWDNACTGDYVYYESIYDKVQDKLGLLPEGAESFSEVTWADNDNYYLRSEMVTDRKIKSYLLDRGWINANNLQLVHPNYSNIYFKDYSLTVRMFKKYSNFEFEIPYLPTNLALLKLGEIISRVEGLMYGFDKSLENIKL